VLTVCGVVGYIGNRLAAPILLDGLSRLEYRGYDSAGIVVLTSEKSLEVRKSAGKVSSLKSLVEDSTPLGTIGMGHTRWATHGGPTSLNAHPHTSCHNEVAVVHNGIVENSLDLKCELIDKGHTFKSETDSEVIAHLIETALSSGIDFVEAVRQTAIRLKGGNAFIALLSNEPDRLVALRLGNGGGIVVGYGPGEMLAASDLLALTPHTNMVAFLHPGEIAIITAAGASYLNLAGDRIEKTIEPTSYEPVMIGLNGYDHFMIKEIMEQPQALTNVLKGRIGVIPEAITFENLPLTPGMVSKLDRVVLLGMGSSFHAAQVGRYMMEALSGIPSEAENAAEFRYRDPILNRQTLVVSVGQSGETADTLGAMEVAQHRGALQIAICNVEGSQATRMSDGVIYMRAWPEKGVAATKTFTASLMSLFLLSVHLGRLRQNIPKDQMPKIMEDLGKIPDIVHSILEHTSAYKALAQKYYKAENFLFVARGINYPVALEGALKLKETSYVHAEGYSAAELKHGAIALLDENIPVVALVIKDALYQKTMANVEEVKARGAPVIAVGTHGDNRLANKVDDVLYVPEVPTLLSPIVTVIPLQLLGYYIGVLRGCDVDQPRNLAKSVTVE
jgi:glucosamine--fructose-6-phosphate aminotransferase (isomerizing)